MQMYDCMWWFKSFIFEKMYIGSPVSSSTTEGTREATFVLDQLRKKSKYKIFFRVWLKKRKLSVLLMELKRCNLKKVYN